MLNEIIQKKKHFVRVCMYVYVCVCEYICSILFWLFCCVLLKKWGGESGSRKVTVN